MKASPFLRQVARIAKYFQIDPIVAAGGGMFQLAFRTAALSYNLDLDRAEAERQKAEQQRQARKH